MHADFECAGLKLVISARGLAILAKASHSFVMMRDYSDFAGVNAIKMYVSPILSIPFLSQLKLTYVSSSK
jgi:hypothetical protein